MSGEGHIADMITRMKNNEALRKGRKDRKKKLSEANRKESNMHENIQFKESDVSPEVLQNLKENIQKKAVNERKSRLIETSVLTAVILLALILVVVLMF